ncbi:MAG TPA: iron-sulfur cluster-binding protein [Anaerolineae bacterium]|nr:iron-sulfur cluster-binding protein [Anaerolineae bacterium]
MRSHFLRRARRAIADPALQSALDRNAENRQNAWQQAFALLSNGEAMRMQAHRVREHTIENLDSFLAQFSNQLLQNGWRVHRAADAEAACRIVMQIASAHDAEVVTKSKSMLSEEIGLNHALERSGVRIVETDLGEFIVQLRGEPPSHIITPAVHLRRQEVAATFHEKLGMPYSTDVEAMTALARRTLRQEFLQSAVGITGVNFGVAESGTLCLVTNEGNGRMVTTVPPVHIALMGLERLVPTLDDLALMLPLLTRAATGQVISTYVSLIQGPRHADDPDGPDERHLILIDNRRSSLIGSEMAEALLCIRCGACLNACPVFRELGGHVYRSVYPGPIGSVLSPALFGVDAHGHLSKASTLCGACREACPVGIDLPTLLLRGRKSYVESVRQPSFMRLAMKLYAWLMLMPRRYRLAQRLARPLMRLLPLREGWLRCLPPPFSAWTRSRHMPPFAARPFRQRYQAAAMPAGHPGEAPEAAQPTPEPDPIQMMREKDPPARFEQELTAVDGEIVRCSAEEAPALVAERMRQMGITKMLAWGDQEPLMVAALQALKLAGVDCVQPDLPRGSNDERRQAIATLEDAQAGLTGAIAGIADTGTMVLADGAGRPSLASLLPPIHVALLPVDRIHAGMQAWLAAGGRDQIANSSNVALVTGPSRTADIEMTLTIGVHGPGKVIVFLVE